MQLVDTHCHIHDTEFFTDIQAVSVLKAATDNGVSKVICIATSLKDSKQAIKFAKKHSKYCYASIGIHPHEASKLTAEQIKVQLAELRDLATDPIVVAVGECGFDFCYNKRKDCLDKQTQLLKGQLLIASDSNLPLSFHVRDAFDDFWPIFEEANSKRPLTGVLHSFTDSQANVGRATAHNLLIGVNGIATFTKHVWQRELFRILPLKNIVIETDAPFLTPSPKRGTINEPRNVIYITKFLAELRGETEEGIAKATTANAKELFKII